MSFSISQDALKESLRAASWYEKKSPGKGDEFLKHLDEAGRIIERQPSAFPRVYPRKLRGEFRVYVLSRFKYSIFYQVRNGDQTVIAVAHHRRRAFYWTRRLKRR